MIILVINRYQSSVIRKIHYKLQRHVNVEITTILISIVKYNKLVFFIEWFLGNFEIKYDSFNIVFKQMNYKKFSIASNSIFKPFNHSS